MNRIAVTGISAISASGNDLESCWRGLLSGESAISKVDIRNYTDHSSNPISGDDLESKKNLNNWPVRIAGQIKGFKLSEDLLSLRDQPRFDRFIHFALHCTDEALQQSQLLNSNFNPYKVGVILGVGLGGFPSIEQTHKTFLQKGPRRISPFFVPSFIPNMACGKISMQYNFRGINHAISSACASASHAIASGATEIMIGRQDAVVVGGTEAVLSALTFAGFNAMKALSKNNDHPKEASRPFDDKRDGFVMGEGGGILILENLDKAKSRGAKILAELVGFGATADAYHITSPHPEGEGTIPCMQQAIEMAQIAPEQIDYINAHGTSTKLGDLSETNAIKKVFKDHAYTLNISSTKSVTGHLLGAAGGLEAVVCVKSLIEDTVPPTVNLKTPSVGCDLNYTPNIPVKKHLNYALNNSFGFGGTNSSLIFKKAQ